MRVLMSGRPHKKCHTPADARGPIPCVRRVSDLRTICSLFPFLDQCHEIVRRSSWTEGASQKGIRMSDKGQVKWIDKNNWIDREQWTDKALGVLCKKLVK